MGYEFSSVNKKRRLLQMIYEQGLSRKQASSQLGVSYSTACRWINENQFYLRQSSIIKHLENELADIRSDRDTLKQTVFILVEELNNYKRSKK